MTGRAVFSAVRYVLQGVLAAFAVWLQQIGKTGWEQISTFDVVFVCTALALAGLNAMGAVMNGSWSEARARGAKKPPETAGG